MNSNTVIFLALGCAVSAGSLYAADSSSYKHGQSGTSAGMTNDTAKSYQNALDNCQKKTGSAKSRCITSALKEKCGGMTGTAKSTCMKDRTGSHAVSPQDSSGMKGQPGDGRIVNQLGSLRSLQV